MALQNYFIRPDTIDRIKASWIGADIEKYVERLTAHGYSPRSVWHRVPVLMQFGEFARARGASRLSQLPNHVEAFVVQWVADRAGSIQPHNRLERDARMPVEQMLRFALPKFESSRSRKSPDPFKVQAPRFLDFLREERGLRTLTIRSYCIQLRIFEAYLARVGVKKLRKLSPILVGSFLTESGRRLGKKAMKGLCAALRTFLRYAYRQRLTLRDLSSAVESPRTYRLAELPRAITWEEVHRMLGAVDRRTQSGIRDYSILLLLVTYGLRAREVAGLRLEDIDWQRAQLHVDGRKAGHSTSYPLSRAVGDALLDYLKRARPRTDERAVFLSTVAPRRAMTFASVAERAAHYLRKAGIAAHRPGSHTLRHTCVQRLVDADFSLKEIGDYVGHGAPQSTQVYAKVRLQPLREVACGDVEDIL